MSLRLLVGASLLLGLGLAGFRGQTAEAFPVFKRRFDAKYLVKGTPLYEAYGGRSTCNVCHLGGAMDREHRNDYGQALGKLLDRADADALTLENARRDPRAAQAAVRKIDEAFQTVEKLPANSHDRTPPTFGQLIRAGKLPISPATLAPATSAR